MKAVLGAILVAVTALIVSTSLIRNEFRKAAFEVCDLIDVHYYLRASDEARQFIEFCRLYASRAKISLSRSVNVERLNRLLSMLRTSHLSIYNPEENRQMWEHQGYDTGLRSRFIEDALVVYRVLEGSPAAEAGVKPGDVIVSINDELASPNEARFLAGVYEFERRPEGRTWKVELKPALITEDLKPRLEDLGSGRGLLTIRSFLSQYFENPAWKKLALELSKYQRLVIDARENAGGSFPAMLRALSPFRCRSPYIGRLYKSDIAGGKGSEDMQDLLDAESQILQLARSSEVRLRTFGDYGCFNGPVVVLVDSDSSSVTEIFAHAFLTRPRSKVLGHSTAGQVVMARWFPIYGFGSEEYQISIPIAGFETEDGLRLENNGVQPHRYLDYDLELALKGRDSWIVEALRTLDIL